MQQESPSIFDKDFIAKTLMRRRDLMPLGLKIYVWFYVVTSILVACWLAYLLMQFDIVLGQTSVNDAIIDYIDLVSPPLLFLSGFFLLLEKKWAILFAVIAIVFLLLHGGYTLIALLISGSTIAHEIGNIFKLLLKVPYVILLLRIKHDWETKAVSGKELQANNNNNS